MKEELIVPSRVHSKRFSSLPRGELRCKKRGWNNLSPDTPYSDTRAVQPESKLQGKQINVA